MFRNLLLIIVLVVPGYVMATEIVVGVGDRNGDALGLQDGKFVGSLANFYQCPFDSLDLDFQVSLLPQVRNLYLLEKGEIDIALPLVRVSGRDQYAIFTRKMADIPFLLYTREENDLSGDISAYKFAVLRSSASADLVAMRNAEYEEVTSWIQALRLAKLGRFDGAVIPEPLTRNLDPDLFDGMKSMDFGTIPMSLYVSKKSRHAEILVRRLNQAIEECQG